MHALYQSITGHVYILHGISACFVLSKINVFQSCHAIRKLVSPENMIRPDILNKHHNSFTLIVHHLFGCSWTDHDKECPTHTKCKSPLTSPAVVDRRTRVPRSSFLLKASLVYYWHISQNSPDWKELQKTTSSNLFMGKEPSLTTTMPSHTPKTAFPCLWPLLRLRTFITYTAKLCLLIPF